MVPVQEGSSHCRALGQQEVEYGQWKIRKEVDKFAFGGMCVCDELDGFADVVEVLNRCYGADVAFVAGKWRVAKWLTSKVVK